MTSRTRSGGHETAHDHDHHRSVDETYGLEPVFEPGIAASGASGNSAQEGVQFECVECPYCGESFETQIDVSAGASSYVEDCQVCCQPIQFTLEVDDSGALAALTVRRSDD